MNLHPSLSLTILLSLAACACPTAQADDRETIAALFAADGPAGRRAARS